MIEVTIKHLGNVKFEVASGTHTLLCDQPESNGGRDEGMTPPDFFLASLGSCAAFYAVAYLKKKGLSQEGVAVRISADKVSAPLRLDKFKIEVQIPFALGEADRIGVDQAVHHCLIHNTLLHPPTIEIELQTPVSA
jgi:putative redox protein